VVCREGRLAELLRGGRFVLVDTTGGDPTPGRSPHVVTARADAVRGEPAVLLVRPDGYVAWATDDPTDAASRASAAVARWCGPAVTLVPGEAH
jgi:hypothetical protein